MTGSGARPRRRSLSLRLKLGLGFAAMAVLVSALTAVALSTVMNRIIIEEIRRRALAAVSLAALQQDGDLFARIASAEDPLYERFRMQNLRIRRSDPDFGFVFTMRKDARGIWFVVDAGDPGEKDIAAFGERYDDPSPTLAASFDTLEGPVADPEIYTDKWGSFLSAYAPIRASDGRRVGVIGVDIRAETIAREQGRIQRRILTLLLAVALLGVLGGFLAGEYLARPVAALTRAAEGIAAGDLERRIDLATGDELEQLAIAFNGMAGQVQKLVRSLERRIEELDAARDRLRESEAAYRTFFEESPFIVAVTDLEGRYVDVNRRFLAGAALTKEAVVGRTAAELGLLAADDHGRIVATLARGVSVHDLPLTASTPAGAPIHLLISATPINIAGRPHVLAIIRDVTEQRRAGEQQRALEKQVAHLQQMEAIARLAGGVAHDFNNILSIIIGCAELGLVRQGANSPSAENLRQVLAAAERAALLVRQILTFSRRAEQRPVPSDIRPILRETLKFLRSSLPATIDLRARIGEVGTVVIDPTQVHQVLMNLGTNAFQAMEERGGVLEVSLEELAVDDASAGHLGLAPGRWALLAVSDNGPGIAPGNLSRVFEPYFTTKEPGKGTGLGLAVVHGVVTGAGGAVRVYSEQGLGTTFHVYLPVVAGEAAQRKAHGAALPTGTERILLVDDEPQIVALTGALLEQLGYAVTVAGGGPDALALFGRDPDAFDLLLTDLTMPRMTGEALTAEVLSLRPGLPVVVCTGFSESLARERLASRGVRAVLVKPVTMARLAATVRAALDGATVPGEAPGT